MKPADAPSRTQAMLDAIKRHGSLRTDQLADVVGCAPNHVSASLDAYVKRGTLVSCRVERPDARAVNEYRISASGKPVDMRAWKGRQPPPGRSREGNGVAPPPPASAPSTAAPSIPAPSTPAPSRPAPTPTRENPVATSAPITDAPRSFACALANDGALHLFIGSEHRQLAPAETRSLIDYLRKLDELSGRSDAGGAFVTLPPSLPAPEAP